MDTLIHQSVNNNVYRIYKYFRIDENFINSIKENFLWFSDPLDFNDPYDCNLMFDFENTEEEIRNYYICSQPFLIKIGFPNASLINIDEKISYHIKNPKEIFENTKESILNHILIKHGICCFSEKFDSLLMWSHYSEKHKGVCLVFDIYKDFDFFKALYKVLYPEKYPKINFIRAIKENSFSPTQFMFATKSRDWQYENEIRIIKHKEIFDRYRGKVYFNKNSLIEVLFGYKTDEKIQTEIINLFNCLNYKVDFSRMKLKENEFGLIKNYI